MYQVVSERRRAALAELFFAAVLAVIAPGYAIAQMQEREAADRLNEVQTQIRRLGKELEAARGEQGRLEQELRTVEMRVGALTQGLRESSGKLSEFQSRLSELEQLKVEQLEAYERQQELLAHQVRAVYGIGRQPLLKLLLSEQDPSRLGRTLAYYEYLNRARAAQLESLRAAVDAVSETERQIVKQTQMLTAARRRLEQEKAELEANRRHRERILVAVRDEIRRKDSQMERLREDERSVKELIARLRAALADIPAALSEQTPFVDLKGSLPWPVAGRIRSKFGQRRGTRVGNLTWRGVVISAKSGARVRAISHGRVAFADWMRGFGLLIILDHGAGYMSLYGHNESLFKGTGDWVEAGEVIASVGDSGGQPSAGLYFEIRHNGKPLDPSSWCGSMKKLARAMNVRSVAR